MTDTAAVLRETLSEIPDPLEQTVSTFERWLYMPDRSPLYTVLATVAANLLPGDPAWLLLVGSPGSGKTELVQPLARLPFVHQAATLTEAALLSGSSAREKAKDASGGLLRTIGEFGIVLSKDFGSVLNMHTDTRAQLLAGLREVYDGSWTRLVGTDGGRTLSWEGKVGFIGGCTQSIDRAHSVTASMGERFIYYRLPPLDASEQARRAMSHAGRDREMRDELAAAVARLFARDQPPAKPLETSMWDAERLVALSVFTVRARSAVERDGHSREIDNVPYAEAPSRLVKVLHKMLHGFDAIGLDRDTAWPILTKIALDSIPALRLKAIVALVAGDERSTTDLAEAVDYPTTTTRRALEDLAAHGVAKRRSQGQGKADIWTLTEWTRNQIAEIEGFPEKPEPTYGGSVPEKPNTQLFSFQELNGNSGTVSQP